MVIGLSVTGAYASFRLHACLLRVAGSPPGVQPGAYRRARVPLRGDACGHRRGVAGTAQGCTAQPATSTSNRGARHECAIRSQRHRPLELAERRVQEKSTSMVPITLYSATMSQLGADRQGQLRLQRRAGTTLCANLYRSSTLRHKLTAGMFGSKKHKPSAATSFCRVSPRSGTT